MADLTTAEVNDILRAVFLQPLKLSESIEDSPDKESIFQAVQKFEFKAGDPNTDHDFGIVQVNGLFYFFSFEDDENKVLQIGQLSEFS